MPHFTIVLQGRGSEINCHSINTEQKEKLEHLDLDNCILEDVGYIMEMDDTLNLIESDEIYIGAYPENSQITVFDESNEEVFSESCDKLFLSEVISENTKYKEVYNNSKLYVNDYIKGSLFTLEVEDENFDISLLEFHLTEIEGMELITNISYKGVESDFGDYWSKGITFFLSES